MFSHCIILVDHLAHSRDIFGIFQLLLIEFVDSLQLHRDFVSTVFEEKFFLKTLLLRHLRLFNDLCGRFFFHSHGCLSCFVAVVLFESQSVLVCLELQLQLIFDLLGLQCCLCLDLLLNYSISLFIFRIELPLFLLHPVLRLRTRLIHLHKPLCLSSPLLSQVLLPLLLLFVHLLCQFLLLVQSLLLHLLPPFSGSLHLVTRINLVREAAVQRKVLLDRFAEGHFW